MNIDKIMCYINNKCIDIANYTLGDDHPYDTEVYLYDVCGIVCMTSLLILFVSWYVIPFRCIAIRIQHLPVSKYNKKFVCPRRKTDGNNKE